MKIIKLMLIGCCLFSTVPARAALNVVTTTQDLAAITEAIGGEFVEVESLTRGTSDPHFAVAKPSMIRKVYKADLLIAIGADMEIGWLPALLQSSRNARVSVGSAGHLDVSRAVDLLDVQSAPVSRARGDVHSKGNPHYWLSPENGGKMAEAIAARLSALDPKNAERYAQNEAQFQRELTARTKVWRERLGFLRGQKVIAYHTSLVYLAAAFGFQIVDEVEPKPGIAPSAASLTRLLTRINAEQISLLLMEPYYERRSAAYLQEKSGIGVAVLPQSVGATDAIQNYFDLFDAIVAELEKAGSR